MFDRTRKNQIAQSLRRLVKVHVSAAHEIENTLTVLSSEIELDDAICLLRAVTPPAVATRRPRVEEPYADPALLSIVSQGRQCFLGNTLPFHFFERLRERPNQYLKREQLLREVWHGQRSAEAVRSVVSVLRQKLIAAGMRDVAAAVDGSIPGHYCLVVKNGK